MPEQPKKRPVGLVWWPMLAQADENHFFRTGDFALYRRTDYTVLAFFDRITVALVMIPFSHSELCFV